MFSGAALLSALFAGPVFAQQNNAKTYDDCMNEARTDPDTGFETASLWRDHGGGLPAEHCVATALIGLKDYQEAAIRLEKLAEAMVREPSAMRADVLSQAADTWMQADMPENAVAALDQAIKLQPENPAYLISQSIARAELKDYNGAIVDLNKAVTVGGPRGDALADRAAAYRALGDLKDAGADAEEAVRIAPDLPEAWLERAAVRRQTGNLTGARQDWRKVLELAPDSSAGDAARAAIEKLELHTDDAPAK